MKILSKMLSKKIEPKEPGGKIDLDMDVEPMRRKDGPTADDSGLPNASVHSRPETKFPEDARAVEASDDGWDDDEWEDEEWDDDDDDWAVDAKPQGVQARKEPQKPESREVLVDEIREAMGAVKNVQPDEPKKRVPSQPGVDERPFKSWANDEDFGRKAMARSAMTDGSDAEDRMFEKTHTAMSDRETSRRRSAMAHLKAAAKATKADRVLSKVASQDPASDPEEQSPYRDDLAKVVRPTSRGRPISRQVSRPRQATAAWDVGPADEDAAMFAASNEPDALDSRSVEEELAAAEAERLARAPLDLSEDEFASEGAFSRGFAKDETPRSGVFPSTPEEDEDISENAFAAGFDDDEFDDEEFDDEFDDDDANSGPVPSSAVSEAVAIGRGEYDDEEDPEEAAREESATRKKIWEMADEVAADLEERKAQQPPENFAAVASVVAGRSGGRAGAGRVKTRLIGFQADVAGPKDVFEETAEKVAAQPEEARRFPAGWIVVVEGPGRGASFTLYTGVSQIGRGEDQAVRLDFGDTSISRNNHAAVAYDDEQGKFFLGHGGKSNLVRLNGRPVLSTEEMSNGDQIRIGETALKFVSLCGEDFTWASTEEGTDTSND